MASQEAGRTSKDAATGPRAGNDCPSEEDMRSRSQVLIQSPAILPALLACLATAAPVSADPSTHDHPPSRVCSTPDVSTEEAQAVQAVLESGKRPGISTYGGVVWVAFHVIHDGINGDVTDQQIQDQIAELNLDFAGGYGGFDTGYSFVLTSVDRTLDADWFNMGQNSQEEHRAKKALSIDPAHHVNIYTANIAAYGWATYPWGINEEEKDHGIVVHYGTLPGGHLIGYNMGRTVTHEMGHYFGLFHTFFTGCSALNDYVADTPAESLAASGCPPDGQDTCVSPGADPIHNFMDYSDDPCYREFTPGQDARMDEMVVAYRPSLVAGSLAVGEARAAAGADFAPVSPNPTRGAAAFRFRLEAPEPVELRIHDLAGRTMATLVNGPLPAGDHRVVWNPGKRSTGVYFAVLEAGGRRATRRFLAIR